MRRKSAYICTLAALFAIGIACFTAKADAAYEYEDGFSYSKITKDIKEKITGSSYKKNPDITLDDLRYVRVKYYNYKGKEKEGELIVNKLVAKDVVKIFYELYEIEYPIRQMKLIDEYDADDNRSMEADNTSCFNYRKIAGSTNLSMHALGLAIDINPKINPCVGGAHGILPANGSLYKERDVKKCKGKYKDMMIHKNDEAYKIFKKYGFSWGGNWKNMKDYQHFYKVPKKYRDSGRYEW